MERAGLPQGRRQVARQHWVRILHQSKVEEMEMEPSGQRNRELIRLEGQIQKKIRAIFDAKSE
jgi:hypothetical protein